MGFWLRGAGFRLRGGSFGLWLGRQKKRTVDLDRTRTELPFKLEVLQYLIVDVQPLTRPLTPNTKL